MGNLNLLHEQMGNGWSLLKNQWETTSSKWNDAARHRFEREFMDGYEETIHATLKQLENLAQVLAQVSSQVP